MPLGSWVRGVGACDASSIVSPFTEALRSTSDVALVLLCADVWQSETVSKLGGSLWIPRLCLRWLSRSA